jgi:Ion channel
VWRVTLRGTIKTFRTQFKYWQEKSREPGLTALLVIEGLLIFLAVPLAGMGLLPAYILPIMFALLVIATLVVTLHSPFAAIAVLISAGLSPVASFYDAKDPSVLMDWLSTGGRLLAIAALSFVIARVVFGRGRVTLHRIQGAVVLYLNFGLFFFDLYQLLAVLTPDAFSGLPPSGTQFNSGADLLYFSFSTLTTSGFGDITPLHPMARNLANLESIIGQLYPATLLARLVSLQIQHRRHSN